MKKGFIITLEFGRQNLLSFAPAIKIKDPAEHACPIQIVTTSGLINCVVYC